VAEIDVRSPVDIRQLKHTRIHIKRVEVYPKFYMNMSFKMTLRTSLRIDDIIHHYLKKKVNFQNNFNNSIDTEKRKVKWIYSISKTKQIKWLLNFREQSRAKMKTAPGLIT